jgi:RNA polymerase sigma factor (sigma-70 family)
MGDEAAGGTSVGRRIDTLFRLGAIGSRPDSELIHLFQSANDDSDRQAAFATLVERHGPMVLGVCRRMLSNPADADDAFQAVFLLLARKAGSLQRADRLGPWLYGVAVRTSQRARRQSIRRQAHQSNLARLTDPGVPEDPHDAAVRAELARLIDEELARLPERFRTPLLLCELNGASRQEAARALSLSEGTLSSRLARGRAALRNRLVRRGVALGASSLVSFLAEGTAKAAIPEALIASTVRIARTGGVAMPPGLAALVEEVSRPWLPVRMKMGLALAAISGTVAGMVWATGRPPSPPPHVGQPVVLSVPASLQSAPLPSAVDSAVTEIRGLVVNDQGQGVGQVEVSSYPGSFDEVSTRTEADGSFRLVVSRRFQRYLWTPLLARSADGLQMGSLEFRLPKRDERNGSTIRIVLKPSREISVRVTDSTRAPVEGASVVAQGKSVNLAEADSGPDGVARLRLPIDGRVMNTVAMKPGVGVDYNELGTFDAYRRKLGGLPVSDLPDTLELQLGASQTVQVQAVDEQGKPRRGVVLSLRSLKMGARLDSLASIDEIRRFGSTSGDDGIAVFDWLPADMTRVSLEMHSPDLAGFGDWRSDTRIGTDPIVVTLLRTSAIRGRVVLPDGSPATGLGVVAEGSGLNVVKGLTGSEGTFDFQVMPHDTYEVFVDDPDWVASRRTGITPLPDGPIDGIDFRLSRGAVVRGQVTFESTGAPAQGYEMGLVEGLSNPDSVLDISRWIATVWTDSQGRYSLRALPGRFRLRGPGEPPISDRFIPDSGPESETFTLKDGEEIIRDFRVTPQLAPRHLTGRVVRNQEGNEGVAGAVVTVVDDPDNDISDPFTVKADAEGRFETECGHHRVIVLAQSADRSVGAIAEVGANDNHVQLTASPMASVTGQVVDQQGRRLVHWPLSWGLVGESGDSVFATRVEVQTDEEGRFHLAGLVVGHPYDIGLDDSDYPIKVRDVRPEKPGLIDLGMIRVEVPDEIERSSGSGPETVRKEPHTK